METLRAFGGEVSGPKHLVSVLVLIPVVPTRLPIGNPDAPWVTVDETRVPTGVNPPARDQIALPVTGQDVTHFLLRRTARPLCRQTCSAWRRAPRPWTKIDW